MSAGWRTVGGIDPESLVSDRDALHQASWILGSVAHALLPAEADDSHSNLGLSGTDPAFRTQPLDEQRALELRIRELELAFRDGGDTPTTFALAGRTMEEALAWAAAYASDTWPDRNAVTRRIPPDDFPESEIRRGAPFPEGDSERRAELGRWFTNSDAVLADLIAGEAQASPLRTWPHHFDIGSLLELSGESGVGVGLSPGDHSYAEPYFYVYAYPAPDVSTLPPLTDAGCWTTTGFTGGLLTATGIVAHTDPEGAVRGFLEEAFARSRASIS